jgi:hypothetical protein
MFVKTSKLGFFLKKIKIKIKIEEKRAFEFYNASTFTCISGNLRRVMLASGT